MHTRFIKLSGWHSRVFMQVTDSHVFLIVKSFNVSLHSGAKIWAENVPHLRLEETRPGTATAGKVSFWQAPLDYMSCPCRLAPLTAVSSRCAALLLRRTRAWSCSASVSPPLGRTLAKASGRWVWMERLVQRHLAVVARTAPTCSTWSRSLCWWMETRGYVILLKVFQH